jgi:DNA double-strand break repair helicase HerA and related ATPase
MGEDGKILIGRSTKPEYLHLPLANRHGLITGATGTGKTVSLQVLAEGFSNAGVPVFAADTKGDPSGVGAPGDGKAPFVKRAQDIGLTYAPDRFPVVFWDLFGEQGHRIRATISEMGPLLLSRLLDLNDTQEGVLNIAFRIADEQGLLLLDLKDLRALLQLIAENAKELASSHGNVTKQSVGTIQRQLLVLENQHGEEFLGEPALDIRDLMKTDRDGRGMINILAADRLMDNPRLYGTFLLWLMSELFEELPEVGDLEKPKLVFFFDEAHLLFEDAPTALVESVERVVRLIRSKGVGVYFITQNPIDVPESVLAQLGNRVQHALRAFTPRDQKAVRSAAQTFRQNPAFDTQKAITELAVGEALVSTLEGKGTPSIVERTLIAPPMGQVGPIDAQERRRLVQASPLRGKYDTPLDPESAYEMLAKRAEKAATDAQAAEAGGGGILDMIGGLFGTTRKKGQTLSVGQSVAREVTRTVVNQAIGGLAAEVGKALGGRRGSSIGRAVVRGTLGGLLKR